MLDARPTILAVADDVARGRRAGDRGRALPRRRRGGHRARPARASPSAHGLDTVVLSGGVFQNRLLLERRERRARARGLRVLVPERLPPNDGGIGYGQAAVAAARSAS